MSAGTRHLALGDEPVAGEDVHFVQMWVPPDTERIDPGYEQLDVNAELDKGGLVPIASGQGHDAAIAIRQRDAVLWGGRLRRARRSPCPTPGTPTCSWPRAAPTSRAPARCAGDAVRLTGAGAPAARPPSPATAPRS